MTHALLSASQSFFTAQVGPTGDRSFPRCFSHVKMSFVSKHRGSGLLTSRNGGLRNATMPVKAEHNCSNTLIDGDFDSNSDDDGNRVDDKQMPLLFDSIHIWWDFGRCPLPLNFDASKIGNTLIDAVRRINKPGAIFFRGYGNVGQLFPKMGEETLRILLESEFPLVGFQMIDDFGPHVLDENIMKADLLHTVVGSCGWAIHMVVVDSTLSTAWALNELLGLGVNIICVHPEQDATEGVWRWEPLSHSITLRLLSPGHNGGSKMITPPANAEHDEENGRSSFVEGPLVGFSNEPNDANKGAFGVTERRIWHLPLTFLSEEVVNIWWDVGVCPLPPNFDSRKFSNVTKALQRFNINGPIYLRVYGIIAEMGKVVARLIRDSGVQLMGFQMIDYNYDYDGMSEDCLTYRYDTEPPGIHVFISDGKEDTSDLDILREEGYKVIIVHPESKAADGAWRWEPLLASGMTG